MNTNRNTISALMVSMTVLMIVMSSVTAKARTGNETKQERAVSAFTGIEVSGAFTIFLSQGTAASVTLEGDKDILDLVRTEVKGNKLIIDNRKPISGTSNMKAYITFKDLKSLDLNGAVEVSSTNRLSLADLSIYGKGACECSLNMDVQKLDVDCHGGSKLKLSGSVKDVEVEAYGAVDLLAFDFPSEKYKVLFSGAGKAEINVSKELEVSVSGAGTIHYKGNPAKNIQDVSGAGSVKKVD